MSNEYIVFKVEVDGTDLPLISLINIASIDAILTNYSAGVYIITVTCKNSIEYHYSYSTYDAYHRAFLEIRTRLGVD